MRKMLLFIALVCGGLVFPATLVAQLSVRASLDGPTAGTSAVGNGTFYGTFSPDLKSMTYRMTVAKLTGPITGAHFHFAPTGGVIQQITFAGNTAVGTWSNIPDTLLQYFFSKGIYVNVHTTANPGGEIRGFLGLAQFFFTSKIDSTGTGSGSSAQGTGYFRWRDTTGGTSSLQYAITFSGLSSAYKFAHFHYAPTGAVLQAISFPDSATANGTWSGYADSILTLLLHGKIYVNIHSVNFPAGEIRGTVTPVGSMPFVAALDSTGEGSGSLAKGTAYAVLSGDMQSISYGATYARLSDTLSESHFHTATNGGVIEPVTFTNNSTTGTWTGFNDVNLQDLLRGRVYLNIHSRSHPAGEIRGTLYYYDGTFATMLNGTSAGTSSNGTGTAWLHFGAQDDSARFRVTFANLDSTYSGSHFHLTPAGTVIEPIATTDSTTGSGTWSMPDTDKAALLEGRVYVNIHSKKYPAGEIRGTLAANLGTVTSVVQTHATTPTSFTLNQNYPNPFNPSTTISFSLTKTDRVTLRVYNLLGQEVATLLEGVHTAGNFAVTFDASRLASGVYFYRLSTASGNNAAKKMLLLK